MAFNEDSSVITPSVTVQMCANAVYEVDHALSVLKVFHDFVEGISQTQS